MPTDHKDIYRSSFEDQTEFISRLRADGTILSVNDVYCRYFGKKAEELIGHTWQPQAHPDDVPRIQRELSHLTPKKPILFIENRVILADGRVRWAQFTNRGFFDDKGQLIELQSVGRDITERRETEEALRASEERFHAIFDATFQFIGLLKPDGTLLEVNNAALEFCQARREDLVGKPLWENPSRQHSAASQKKLKDAIARAATGQFVRFTDEVQSGSGQMVSLDISIKPQHDASGAVTYLIFESRDITASKLQEEERLMATKLESLGVLAGGIAHDLNNIMMCISLNLELLRLQARRGTVNDEHISDAMRNVGRASDLSKRLLTFAKGGDPVLTRIDFGALTESAVNLSLIGSNLQPVFRIERGLPPVLGDHSQLTQVIDQLVINAREASPRGGKLRVTLSCVSLHEGEEAILQPGRYLKLEIEDSGCGISRENISRIFDPYFTTKPTGTGVGLTACFSIVRRHAGTINVRSKIGEGSTFAVLLPASTDAILDPSSGVTGAVSGVNHPRTKPAHILIIEDDASLRDALSQMLSLSGFTVVVTDKGETGFAQFRKALRAHTPFDAVLIDATITGGKGGTEALELLRRADPNVRAVIMSGYSETGVLAEWRELGFRAALAKPFTCEKVVTLLNQVCK